MTMKIKHLNAPAIGLFIWIIMISNLAITGKNYQFLQPKVDPTPMVGNYFRAYLWGKIASATGKHCLQSVGDRFRMEPCSSQQQLIPTEQLWILTPKGELRWRYKDGHLVDECIDMPTESKRKPGGFVQKWSCQNAKHQQWELIHIRGKGNDALFMFKSEWGENACLEAKPDQELRTGVCNTANEGMLFKLAPGPSGLPAGIAQGYDSFPQGALLEHKIPTNSWMEKIYKNHAHTPINEVIIPGSHDAGTYRGFSKASRTQGLDISGQLNAGSRVLDLRFGDGIMVHGIEKGPAGSAEEVLKQIASFAKKYPKEIIFLDVHGTPEDDGQLQKLKILFDKYLIPFLIPNTLRGTKIYPKDITFGLLWKEFPGKNLIFLARNYPSLSKILDPNILWDKNMHDENKNPNSLNPYYEGVWANSTNFKVIYDQNMQGLMKRDPKKWIGSGLIRTPDAASSVVAYIGLTGGVLGQFDEKTDDGYFNINIGTWLYYWLELYGLKVNIVSSDFIDPKFNYIIPMALWLNLKSTL